MSSKLVHAVLAQRWGDPEAHHYIVGIFTNVEDAELCCKEEEAWRGGKYKCIVVPTLLDDMPEYEWEDCTEGEGF